jgi:hypothetical protein
MLLVAAPREIQFGPVSVTGGLTLLVAVLALCLLPGHILGSALENSPAAPAPSGTRVPWTLWAFFLFSTISFINVAMSGRADVSSVQQICIYISFFGSIVLAAAATSPLLVEKGWNLLRTVSTWFAYLAFLVSVLGVGPVAADKPGPARAMAIVGLVVLAIVIPGVAENKWIQFSPFAMVAAMGLTLSRTATVIGLASLVFLVLRGQRSARGTVGGRFFKSAFLIAAISASAYWLVVDYAPFRDRFLIGDNAWKVGDLNISTQGRFQIWQTVLSHAEDNRVFGHGVGAASRLVTLYYPGLDHPHDEYLRFYFDFGIVGAALFFIGYATLGWRVWLNARLSDHPLHWSAFIALLGVALAAVTDNPFVYPFVMLPLGSLIGLSLARARFERIEVYPLDVGQAVPFESSLKSAQTSRDIQSRA